jgi:hypothetical protein
MHLIKLALAVAVPIVGVASVSLPSAQAAAKQRPGSCGEYEYWHDGKCVDARQKAPGDWSEGMSTKSQW